MEAVMQKVVVLGAGGALGTLVAGELDRRAIPHRLVGRDAAALERRLGPRPGREFAGADVEDVQAVRRAVRGADSVLYLVGVPYDRFELHPRYMRTTLDAALAEGVGHLTLVGTVYPFGRPQTPLVSELHPRTPNTYKGKMRLMQEELVLEAHRSGRIATAIVRLPDFYGPFVEKSFPYGVLCAALAGKTADVVGPIDVPHEFVYLPDAAPVIADLLGREDAFGSAYNLGGAGKITMREFARLAFAAAGKEPKLRVASKTMLRLLGVVNPMMRELVEMHYLWTDPVFLDDALLQSVIGPIAKTPYETGIRASLEAMREKVPA
jgi:nucleoside-diphosphate-sugar epimerase